MFGSVATFTQTPAQLTMPAEQTQAPETQVRPAAHTLLQVPQLFGSVARFLQTLPHAVKDALQLTPQVPNEQKGVPLATGWQTEAQAPQLFGSLRRLAQLVPPQSAVPAVWQMFPHFHW